MTGDDFAARASALLGGRGWMEPFARACGVHRNTVWRWTAGELDVPTYAVSLLELLEAMPRGTPLPERWHRKPRTR